MKRIAIPIGTLFLLAAPAVAQQTPPQAQPQPCAAAEFRQFDFWTGSWMVTDTAGRHVGDNDIVRVSDGCGVQENWRPLAGPTGVSVNFYDARSRSWNQLWVGGRGLILRLSGSFHDGAMRMEGESASPRGPVLHRATWTPRPDGTVHQLWLTSADGGRSWSTAADLVYHRR